MLSFIKDKPYLNNYQAANRTPGLKNIKRNSVKPKNYSASVLSFKEARAQKAATLPDLGIANQTFTTGEVADLMLAGLEAKDKVTAQHSRRVPFYARALALAYIEDLRTSGVNISQNEEQRFLKETKIAAKLHDIGKLGTPDSILKSHKKFDLNGPEVKKIRQHSRQGAMILGTNNKLTKLADVARNHHEPLNGDSFPDIITRIVAVADVFDAIMSKRPYKKAGTFEQAERILRNDAQRGKLDAKLVNLFLNVDRPTYNQVKEM